MRRSYLGDFIGVYPRFLILISIVLRYLACGNNLIKNYRAIILY